nr:diacylglycerol kinase family lipid kinase [Eubacterium sp.]
MYYFIVNYTGGSGNARGTWNRVHDLLKEKEVEYKAYVTKYGGHAGELARRICSETEDEENIKLVVVGGDGTINEVLNGIDDFSKISFGIIPTGSGNDFARGMGIPKDTDQALDMILNSENPKSIDLGEVITESGYRRIFGISSGIGLDAIVCKKMLNSKAKAFLNKFKMGSLAYILLTIQTLFSMETYKVKVWMKVKDGKDSKASSNSTNFSLEEEELSLSFKNLIFLAAMNFSAEGGGVPMNPAADAEDGLLSICAVSGIPRWRTFLMLPVLM